MPGGQKILVYDNYSKTRNISVPKLVEKPTRLSVQDSDISFSSSIRSVDGRDVEKIQDPGFRIKTTMKNKMTFKQYLARAREAHPGSDYSYDEKDFGGKRITVTCNKHKQTFSTDRAYHILGVGKCPTCTTEARAVASRIKFEAKLKKLHPTLEILTYNVCSKLKCELHCKKHNHTFSSFSNNVLHGFGCNQCLKEKRAEAEEEEKQSRYEKIKLLIPMVSARLVEKWGDVATKQTNFTTVCRQQSEKILSSLKGDVSNEEFVEERIRKLDVDSIIISQCESPFRAEHDASQKKLQQPKDNSQSRVLEEQSKYPGSRVAFLTDGTGNHHYLCLADNTYKIPGDDNTYTNIMEVNAAFRPVYLPVTSSVIPQMSEEEKENEEGFRKARLVIFGVGDDKLFPEEFFIEKTPWAPFKEQLEAMEYRPPLYGGNLITIVLDREDGSQKHLFLTFTDDGTPYLYGSKRTFNSPGELISYLENTSASELIDTIYGPTTQNND